jgi:hypothetical protein
MAGEMKERGLDRLLKGGPVWILTSVWVDAQPGGMVSFSPLVQSFGQEGAAVTQAKFPAAASGFDEG